MFCSWVDPCKESVLKSSEWRKVSQELHNILSEKLSRDRVGFFADLSFNEQLAYIKQIKRYELNNTKIYNNFIDKLRESIEHYITIQIQKLEENSNDNNLRNLSRLDKILHVTAEGTAKLLHDFPHSEIEHQLSGLGNSSLSPNLRKEIWKLLLFNNQKKYQEFELEERSLDTERSFTIHINTETNTTSVNTFRITEKCENILLTLSQTIEIPNINSQQNNWIGFGDLNTLLPLMKNVMVKYHQDIGFFNQETENVSLCDERYFYFIIPILVCVSDFLIESLNTKINMYNLFEFKASKWFKELLQEKIGSNYDNDITLDDVRFGTDKYYIYYQQLQYLIMYKAPTLLSALKNIAVSAQLMMDHDDEDNTKDNEEEEQEEEEKREQDNKEKTEESSTSSSVHINWIRAIIEPLVEEMIEYWFVKTVNIETTLHIWDQLMLKKF